MQLQLLQTCYGQAGPPLDTYFFVNADEWILQFLSRIWIKSRSTQLGHFYE